MLFWTGPNRLTEVSTQELLKIMKTLASIEYVPEFYRKISRVSFFQ